MPCSDGGWGRSTAEEDLREKVDTLTELLCEACQIIDTNVGCGGSPELINWWEEHQEADKERLEKEAKELALENEKAEALAKLTPRQREILDLIG